MRTFPSPGLCYLILLSFFIPYRGRAQICWAWLILHNAPLSCNAPVGPEQPCLSNIKCHYTVNKMSEKHSVMTSLLTRRCVPVLDLSLSCAHGPSLTVFAPSSMCTHVWQQEYGYGCHIRHKGSLFPHVVEFISLKILHSLPYFELDTFTFCKTFPLPPCSAKKKLTKCNNFFF